MKEGCEPGEEEQKEIKSRGKGRQMMKNLIDHCEELPSKTGRRERVLSKGVT